MEEGKKNEQPDKRPTTVIFSVACFSFGSAAMAFSRATSVGLFNCSLVGKIPRWKDSGREFFSHSWLTNGKHNRLEQIVGPFRTPGEYSRYHRGKRKFINEEGLAQFVAYLQALVEDARIGDRVVIKTTEEVPLYYEAEGSTCWIGISKNGPANLPYWTVHGGATVRNPDVLCRTLTSRGFEISIVHTP